MQRSHLIIIALITLCSIASWAAEDYQKWNSPRDYDPVTITGENITSFLGQPVSSIYAYSYHQTDDSWIQIPLQIDERDDSSHIWIPAANGILDINDELIFMARDMGDDASSASNWINNDASQNYNRYEIRAVDPNDPAKIAFSYLYFSNTLTDTSETYISYSEDLVGDPRFIIEGISYVEKHGNSGLSRHWSIPEATGGNAVNLLDRQKARLQAKILTILDIDITENDLTAASIEHVTGKVRVSSQVTFIAEYYNTQARVQFSTVYYPYSIRHDCATDIFDDPAVRVNLLRQSFDFNSSANGMTFHNNFNRDIPVDGSPTPDDTMHYDVIYSPDINWQMLSGTQGSIITLTQVDNIGTSRLYYVDDDSGGITADATSETGDGESWGDAGYLVEGNALDDRFGFPCTNYFLAANQPISAGSEYAANMQNPLTITVEAGMVPVELVSFRATVDRDIVTLRWSTATEMNNSGFEIQRKNAASTEWFKLNFVRGHGTTAEPHNYSYADMNVQSGSYHYRLKQTDFNGAIEFSNQIEVTVSSPNIFSLDQNFPNPFNPVTKINYQLPDNDNVVSLDIYNLLGERIKTLVRQKQAAGFYTVYWDGKDELNRTVPTGIYVYRLQAGQHIATNRMVLMK